MILDVNLLQVFISLKQSKKINKSIKILKGNMNECITTVNTFHVDWGIQEILFQKCLLLATGGKSFVI